MKKVFFLVAFIVVYLSIISNLQAVSYYFSSSTGLDSYSAIQAKNQSTPWQTINKLNSIMGALLPGDSVLFKRGDSFPGSITVGVSGTAGHPITFGSYGTGTSKPKLDGRLDLTGWTDLGGHIWEVTSSSLNSQPSALMINDVLQPFGRYPNIDAPNRGYLSVTTHPAGSKTEFTDITLAASPDWTGAEVVVRTSHWTLDRRTVATHLGQTITLGANTGYEIVDKFGYFFQNHPAALDKDGEWCYLSSGKKIRLYSTTDPNTKVIKVANTDYYFDINAMSYLAIDGLIMYGAKKSAVNLNKVTYCTIKNCDFLASGTNALNIGPFWGTGSDSITISGNTFTNTQSNCINAGGKRLAFLGNTIKKTGMVPGMAESGQCGLAINTLTDGLLIKRNRLDSIGYSGIGFLWSNNLEIAENVINHFCSVTDDGGGIYCWTNATAPVQTNRKIIKNLVLNGVGAPEGTNGTSVQTEGIYIDDRSSNVDIIENTVAFCANTGIYLHNAGKVKVKNNTVFSCGTALWMKQDIIEFPIAGCDIQNNLLVANSPDPAKSLLRYQLKDETSMEKLGTLNNNIYCQPFFKNDYIKYRYVPSSTEKSLSLNLTEWQTFSGYDLHSVTSPRSFNLFSKTLSDNGVYNGKFESNTADWSLWNPEFNTSTVTRETGQLDGGCLAFKVTGTGIENSSRISTAISSIIAGKSYLLKLSIKSTILGSVYCAISAANYTVKTGTTRLDQEILFTANTTQGSPTLNIYAGPEDGIVYLDNISLYEVEISNPNDFIRFEYNTTAVTRTITADKNYITPAGVSYSSGSTIPISAFSSVVLLKSDIVSGIELHTVTNNQLFKLYPNPAIDQIYIASDTGIIQTFAALYDFSGKVILQEMIRPGFPIYIGQLPKGIYAVRISNNKQSQTLKLIKL